MTLGGHANSAQHKLFLYLLHQMSEHKMLKKAHATVTLSSPSTLVFLDIILRFFANTKHALTAHNRIFLYPVTGKLFKGYSIF